MQQRHMLGSSTFDLNVKLPALSLLALLIKMKKILMAVTSTSRLIYRSVAFVALSIDFVWW